MTTPSFLEQAGFSASIERRFFSRLLRMPNGCLEWTGARRRFGHGAISRGGRGTGLEATHRLAWILANQQAIPAGKFICHHCDNPPCCEPEHLYLGSAADNTADMKRRNRFNPSRGPANARWRVPDAEVRAIRAEYTHIGNYAAVAREHAVTPSFVRQVVLGISRADA